MIELKAVSKTYRMGSSNVRALDNVDLKIEQGEFVAVIGASGSGKSTLLHVLGFLDRPDSGTYLFQGRDVTKLTNNALAVARNRVAGFVFQQFHLLPRISATINAMLPLVYAGRSNDLASARRRIDDVGLADRRDHAPNELSGGEQQRVAIARALVNDPVILFADEPTGNLDTRSEDEIVSILKDLNRQGRTVIMVTHEMDIAKNAGRIIQMRDGRIVSDTRNENNDEESVKGVELGERIRQVQTVLDGKYRGERAGITDHLKQAFHAIFAHKMRAFLSMLGILIGVASVIAMISITGGATRAMEANLKSLGSNLLIIRAARGRVHGVSMAGGGNTRFTQDDVKAVSNLELVNDAYPTVSGRAQIIYGGTNWNTSIEGTAPAYETMRASQPQVGRFFTQREVEAREKVVLLGTTVVENLFGSRNPVGETVKIDRINFKVIGVLPPKGTSSWRDFNDTVVMPVTTAMYRLLGKKYVDYITIEVVGPDQIDQAKEDVIDLMAIRHRWPEGFRDGLHIHDMTQIKDTLSSTTRTMGWLLGSIAAISLFVGGIGIMNIMLVSVTERTREIGLRKAVGARWQDIMTQFLIESIVLTFAGGLMGVALGTGSAYGISLLANLPFHASIPGITIAVSFSVFIGLVFGLWPARQAARLDPISALRYE